MSINFLEVKRHKFIMSVNLLLYLPCYKKQKYLIIDKRKVILTNSLKS